MKIYISGYDKDRRKEMELRLHGAKIVKNIEDCDAICLMGNWQSNEQSIKEHALAGVLGKVIMFEVEE